MTDTGNEYEEKWLSQAKILSEALPHMRRYTGSTVVVKYGGHAMGDKDMARLFARDIVLLHQVGINPIVVHGGGPQIGDMLGRLGVESEFVDGLRVTDEATVEVVEMVLSGAINKEIAAAINAAGGRAIGLSGKDANLIQAEKLQRTVRDPESNIERVLDLGLVGQPKQIDPHVLAAAADSRLIPVIAPLGVGPNGETFNINADTVAGAVAGAVGAKRLIVLTDVSGVLDGDGNLISELTVDQARAALADGTIVGGMIPKVETCLDALASGVDGAVISSGRVAHAVLVELFTAGGAGTLISGV